VRKRRCEDDPDEEWNRNLAIVAEELGKSGGRVMG